MSNYFYNLLKIFMINKISNTGFNFDNSYIELPPEFYSPANLQPVKSPQLVILNNELSNSLGLNTAFLKSQEGIYIMSGNIKIPDAHIYPKHMQVINLEDLQCSVMVVHY